MPEGRLILYIIFFMLTQKMYNIIRNEIVCKYLNQIIIHNENL